MAKSGSDGAQSAVDDETLARIQDRVADANEQTARAVSRTAGLGDNPVRVAPLSHAHTSLLDAYQELVRAIDRLERGLDDSDTTTTPTPKQLISDHSKRLQEQYDDPVFCVAVQLLHKNRREWLHRKPDTMGAEAVERHGLTENQRTWLNQLQDAWEAYDDG